MSNRKMLKLSDYWPQRAMEAVAANPGEARRRLLNALERLEELPDRPWRTGEDYFQPLKVGVTLLPRIA